MPPPLPPLPPPPFVADISAWGTDDEDEAPPRPLDQETEGSEMELPSIAQLRVVCWRVENLALLIPPKRQIGDDDIYCVCKFKGNLGSAEDMSRLVSFHAAKKHTDVHYRARCDGSAIFCWRWTFDVPEPKYFFVNQAVSNSGPKQSTLKFCPKLNIYVRSLLKDKKQAEMNTKLWADKPEALRGEPPEKVDPCDQASSLGYCEVDLFQLFENSATNHENKSPAQTWLESSNNTPKRVQVLRSQGSNSSSRDAPAVAVLSIELCCPENHSAQEHVGSEEGRVKPQEINYAFQDGPARSPCGPMLSTCVPL